MRNDWLFCKYYFKAIIEYHKKNLWVVDTKNEAESLVWKKEKSSQRLWSQKSNFPSLHPKISEL